MFLNRAVIWFGVITGVYLPSSFSIAQTKEMAVVVLARGNADGNLAVRIERDLRDMVMSLASKDPTQPKVKAIEHRFDVGNLSKGHLSRSRRQFNSAQRALEKDDYEKAKGHLFRARRFYNRASPHASDPSLLKGIFYYDYLILQAIGKTQKAAEAYCSYVALGRALSGNAGPLEQFEPLADKCGGTSTAGTGELRITSNVDGAHVYVDNVPVGVIGRSAPYVNPFLPAGPHLLEVRKVGFVRWGMLASLSKGKTLSIKAKIKEARASVRATDYDPLMAVILKGKDKFSDEYLTDFLFRMADQFGVNSLVIGFVDAGADETANLTLLTFRDERVTRYEAKIPTTIDGYRTTLKQYWLNTFKTPIELDASQTSKVRFSPALFRVE